MEHNFNGPLYTLGIEEELMIVDARSMELVPAHIDREPRAVVPHPLVWYAAALDHLTSPRSRE